MAASTHTAPLVHTAWALLLAIVLAPAVRGVTADLNHSIGRVWPFSLSRCHTPSTPGCEAGIPGAEAGVPPTFKQATR